VQVGRYRFVDRLAVGGMAEVFVAVAQGAEGFEKPVVIKRLLPELASHPRFQQMFLDEARIMLSLQHGNIVQILDMGRMEGVPYLALEYVDGRDLRTVLRRAEELQTTVPHGLAAYIAREVCRALDYAHRKTDDQGRPLNIVHRDVNPANIFLSHEGEVKVGDFGLARARDNLEQSDAGIIKGKLSYLSPEQASGQPIDHRSDIFSFGVTLYEMACGRRPFVGENDVQVVMAIREARYLPPAQAREGFHPSLAAVIERCLAHDPAERYPTANHVREDLTRYLQQLPTSPGDRELADFINSLFAAERRSNSFLMKLTPLAHLPPPMAAVSRAGGLSEFEHSATPSPLELPLLPSRPAPQAAAPPRDRPRPPAATAAGTIGGPRAAEGRPRRRGTQVIVALAALAALAITAAVLVKALRPASASLSIASQPAGAAVFVDGADTGLRTPARLGALALGRELLITLRHPEGGELTRRWRVERAGEHSWQLELHAGKEALSVDSVPPSCDVYVDGELRGQTPMVLTLVPRKKYAIELRKRGYLTKTVQHHAERDKDALRLQLEPEPAAPRPRPRPTVGAPRPAAGTGVGVLEVVTEQRGKVYVDGRLVGQTPGFRVELPAGTYGVMVVPEGAKIRHAATITVVARQTHRLTLTPPR